LGFQQKQQRESLLSLRFGGEQEFDHVYEAISRDCADRDELDRSDFGPNIHFEGDFYCNFNTTILDCSEVKIGNGVLFGPNVHIYAATHSVSITEREAGYERALPVSIGRNTWV
jgi:acetyltransferase-like isoleucine patch superfamily enzyme